MIRRAALSISALALAATLLLNFQGSGQFATAALQVAAGSSGSGTTASSGSSGGSGSTSGNSGSTSGSSGSTLGSGSGSAATPAPASGSATGTYAGAVVMTPYGPVQVQITVGGGQINDVQALSLPTGGHSGRISNAVAPMLRSEALTAQSASINVISGATYTSIGYARSLQSAIDAAGI